jgi:hypothetical protein
MATEFVCFLPQRQICDVRGYGLADLPEVKQVPDRAVNRPASLAVPLFNQPATRCLSQV